MIKFSINSDFIVCKYQSSKIGKHQGIIYIIKNDKQIHSMRRTIEHFTLAKMVHNILFTLYKINNLYIMNCYNSEQFIKYYKEHHNIIITI
jgi:hypothetical protein